MPRIVPTNNHVCFGPVTIDVITPWLLEFCNFHNISIVSKSRAYIQQLVVANINIDLAPFIVLEALLVKCFKITACSFVSWYSLNGIHLPNLRGILAF